MRTYVTGTPCHGALIDRRRSLIRLAFNAQIHDLIPANGTLEGERQPTYIIDLYIPAPQTHAIPLASV